MFMAVDRGYAVKSPLEWSPKYIWLSANCSDWVFLKQGGQVPSQAWLLRGRETQFSMMPQEDPRLAYPLQNGPPKTKAVHSLLLSISNKKPNVEERFLLHFCGLTRDHTFHCCQTCAVFPSWGLIWIRNYYSEMA